MDEKELNGTPADESAELGIAENEWDTLKLDRLNEAVRSYRESGRLDAKRAEIQAQKEKASANEAVRMSIDKNDDRVDNWLKVNRLQLPLPNAQNPSVNDSISDSAKKSNSLEQNSSEKSSNGKVTALKERLDAKKIDTYCRENIEDYAGLSAANQSMIRKVVREGRVHALSEEDILSCGRVAARTGLNIEYDATLDTSSTASGPPSPTGEGLAKKILDFFTDAARAYSKDAKLSREARRHYKSFKAMFDAFAERNKGRNAMTAVERTGDGKKSARMAYEFDGNNIKYWQIESEKDIFANLTSVKDLQKAAYNFILKGDKGSRVTDIIDGERLEFIRISAGEYVYGEDSKQLTEEEYKQKMRMSTSIIDLIENASISYDAPDHKNHKLFPDGFKNYQGRVGIDSTIFKYIVRVGKAKNGKIFYDICLEVDGKVPRAKRTSLIKSSTSVSSISQSAEKSTASSKKVSENSAEGGKSIRK